MKKKIVYLIGATRRNALFYEISKKLNNYNSLFLITDKNHGEYFKNKKINSNLHYILQFYAEKKDDINKLKKYDLSLWQIWTVTGERRNNWKIPKKKILSWMLYIIEETERFIKKFKPDYLVCYGPAGYHTLLIYQIMKKNGVKIIELQHSRIRDRFTIVDNLEDKWPLLEREYKKIKRRALTKKEKELVLNFKKEFLNKSKKSQSEDKYKENLLQFSKRVGRWALRNIKNHKLPSETILLKWKFRELLIKILNPFEKSKNEKFVLFPLHYQPEVSTSWYGRWHMNQLALAEKIAKALPVDYNLYIKEHTTQLGSKTLRFYKELKKIPNVRLIDPKEDTFELIKRSSLVATITGTVGLESILYFNKPVITFGDVFYNLFEDVEKIKCIEDLPKIIRNKLDKEIPENRSEKYRLAMIRSTYPGFARCPGDAKDRNLNDENITKLAEGIKQYIKEMK